MHDPRKITEDFLAKNANGPGLRFQANRLFRRLKTSLPPATQAPSSALAASIHAPKQEMHSIALLLHSRTMISDKTTKMLIEWLIELPPAYGVEVNSVHDLESMTYAEP
ncbi:hypothetical protein Dda_3656 [Drechslerella dactyloides]|uniref:Uncharacterized protein n=1 Tax=Drechslerella dactyloides TaxID=74499 RepID=A0AAD6IYT6_DREDA|nr:hypothetical protein Dda_3656 [Drechslerella dactyloides]